MSKPALIFDMDGVIADTRDQHHDAWFKFAKDHDVHISEKLFRDKLFGRTSEEAISILLDRDIGDDEMHKLVEEKEATFRKLAKGQIKSLPGLNKFLEACSIHNLPMIVATSAPSENVKFTLDETNTGKYFDKYVSADDVSNSKPDPEVFLTAAEKLGQPPINCIVFEDSYAGVKAGKKAGMKVVALATTHDKDELAEADLIARNFLVLDPDDVLNLINV